MTIPNNSAIPFFSTTSVAVAGNGALIANGGFSLANDASFNRVTNGESAPHVRVILSFACAVAPAAGQALYIHLRALNISGANDESAPAANFSSPRKVGLVTVDAVTTTQYMYVIMRNVPDEFEVYVENQTGQNISAGWTCSVEGYAVGPKTEEVPPLPPATYTPMYELDFESGSLGALANGADGITSYTLTTYSASQSVGAQSAQMICPGGGEGFGIWGGERSLTPRPVVGDTVWVRWAYYVPTDAIVAAGPGFLKHMRLNVVRADETHLGYLDLLLNNAGGLTFGNELANPTTSNVLPNSAVIRDQWLYLEMAVTLDPVNGAARIWYGEELVGEFLNIQTCDNADDDIVRMLINTNYNNGSPIELENIVGTFGVGNLVSAGSQGGGEGRTSFATISAALSATRFRLSWNTGGYGLAIGDVLTDDVTGATGTIRIADHVTYFDDLIITIDPPTTTDAAGNLRIGTAKRAVSA